MSQTARSSDAAGAGSPAAAVSPLAIWVALVTVYLVWGSTYLAIRVVVETTPPLLAMGARFLVAGALLGAFLPCVAAAERWPCARVSSGGRRSSGCCSSSAATAA